MNPAKKALVRTRDFVIDHKVAITAVSTAAVTTVVVKKVVGANVELMRDFLESEGLLEKFQTTLVKDF